MKIDEAKRLKKDLQETIKSLISGFEQQTGLNVKSIDFNKHGFAGGSDTSFFINENYVSVITEGL